MFSTKHSIGRTNSIHGRGLRLTQQNCNSDFEILLEDANENQFTKKA